MAKTLFKIAKNLNFALAIIGLLIFTSALPTHNLLTKNLLFIIGATLLAISSYFEKEYFFANLELIAIINAVLVILKIPTYLNTLILIILVLVVIFAISKNHKITNQLLIGFSGLILLSLGIIFVSNIAMLIAGIMLVIYSLLSIKSGFKVGWVFLILNIIFTTIAILQL